MWRRKGKKKIKKMEILGEYMGIWNVRVAGGDLAKLSYHQRRVIYRRLYVAPIDYVTAHLSGQNWGVRLCLLN